MLKYLIGVFAVMLLVLGGLYAYFSRSMFIDFRPNAPVSATFRAEGSTFMYLNPEGEYVPIMIRGVEISPAVPGQRSWDFGATMEDYLRWFGYIYEMGANTLYTTTIMNPAFYNALHSFNTADDRQLLLFQGVFGHDYATLTSALKEAIDIIHGRRVNPFGDTGIQIFRRDISPWVVGLLVGAEWEPDSIVFMNRFEPNLPGNPDYFNGEFFSTAYGATPFEVMLAMVMENATRYEARRFKVQRPIGFISSPATDFLEYDWAYATQLRKYVQLNHENIIALEPMLAGTFAAYRLFYFAEDFISYLTPSQSEALGPILESLDRNCFLNGYIDLLAQYHSMPVVAMGVGFSTSRAPEMTDRPPLNEVQQGEHLARAITQIEAGGWAGSIISTWQDTWERRTWNTTFSSNPWRYQYWHNLQSIAQGYGLMAFEPGRYTRPVLIDGNAEEWDYSHRVHSHDGISIYAQYSTHGLYLLVRGYGVNPQNVLYLPIDITPASGTWAFNGLDFARPSNFVLILSGEQGTRLMVNRRYHATYQRFYEEMTGTNPFTGIPPVWDSYFVPITLALQSNIIIDTYTFLYLTDEARELRRLQPWEAGRLTHGIGDPASEYFNSLADFSFGEGVGENFGENLVEIRLPWMLLNFYDPSLMQVHDDYFYRFGVEGLGISEIYIGVTAMESESDPVPMSPIPLQGWGDNVEFHERLKQSYFIIQELWR